MIDPTFGNRLHHMCDIMRDVGTTQSSTGMPVADPDYIAQAVPCNFVEVQPTVAAKDQGFELHIYPYNLQFMPDVEIETSYMIDNIRIASTGEVVEAGPLHVERVKTAHLAGTPHHKTAGCEKRA